MFDSTVVDELTDRADRLFRELSVPEQPAQHGRGRPVRGADVNELIRLLIDLGKTYGPYLGWVLWFIELLITRRLAEARRQYNVFISAAAGILQDRRMAPADIEKAEQMAADELRKLGLQEDKVMRGAKEAVALLLTDLKPKRQGDGEDLGRVLTLAGSVEGWEVKEQPYGCSIDAPTRQGGKCRVHLFAEEGEEGEGLVKFLGVAGRVDPDQYRMVLKKSGELTVGAFTIRSVRGVEYYAVQETLRLEQVTFPELQRVVSSLADKAVELRENLGIEQ